MNSRDFPSQPIPDRQVIKTKTFGRAERDPPSLSTGKSESAYDRVKAMADKKLSEALDEAVSMRHLEYEVIKDADIIQVSVINNEDGKIVRKVPPDKVVEIARKIHEKLKGKRLDVKI